MIVVGAIIRNWKHEFLLQLRDDCAPSFPDCWTIFGGIVETAEQPERAIKRELVEELELDSDLIVSLKQTTTYVQTNGTRQVIFELLTNASIDQLHLKEGRAIEFVPPKDLFKRSFAFNIEEVLLDYTNADSRLKTAA